MLASTTSSTQRSAAAANGPELPIPGYDELTARQVVERLGGLKPADLRTVRDYELRRLNRKSVLDPIERSLG